MPSPVLRVVGGRALRRELKAAGEGLQDLKDAHRDVAEIVTRAANPPRVSGALAASVRPGASKTAALARAGGVRVPYANTVHWGNNRPGHERRKANPFLSDAAQRTEPQWLPVYEADVRHILDTVKGATP